jgi:phage tail tape-measure protein
MDDRTRKGVDPNPDANRDPLSGEPGAHPVGVAGGGTGGALAGAAVGGAVGGPVGALVGGAIGAVAEGYGGKAAAEALDPTVENAYWKGSYNTRPYVKKGSDYSDYEPAYRYGWEAAANPDYKHRQFSDVEPDLEKNWSTYRGPLQTEWRDVRDATRDSYERIRNRVK